MSVAGKSASKRPVAMVTGAGRGIGRAIALELARRGFDVAGLDIVYEPDDRAKGLFEVKAAVERLGRRFLPVACDVAAVAGHGKTVESVFEAFGRVDVLVNNAGVAPEKRLGLLGTTPASYDRVMGVNARGAFFLTQAVARRMAAQPAGRSGVPPSIVFITSVSASVSSPARPEYCMSKAALSMAATLFADDLAPYGISVFEVRPGVIATDMTAPVKAKYDRMIARGLVPQGRWGRPEDVGRAVAALAGGDFAYSTGLSVEVSGGMNIRRL
jgi:NAD(P)-dependent dehydrogenase (short-subunit alcohol dehydrogenase family)